MTNAMTASEILESLRYGSELTLRFWAVRPVLNALASEGLVAIGADGFSRLTDAGRALLTPSSLAA